MNETFRRRLVGATVLVVVGVVLPFALLQWFQDSAPERRQGVRVYEITPDGQARPAESAERGPPPAAGSEKDTAPSGPAAGEAAQPAASEPAPETRSASDEKTQPEVAETPAGSDATAPSATSAEDAGPTWSVQVASFRSPDNARAMLEKLRADYPAFASEFTSDGVTYHRVRVGPYSSEVEARRVAAALEAQGLGAQIRREP